MVAEEVPGTIPLHWKPKYPLDHERCTLGARANIFQALSDEPKLLQMSLIIEAVSDPKRLRAFNQGMGCIYVLIIRPKGKWDYMTNFRVSPLRYQAHLFSLGRDTGGR